MSRFENRLLPAPQSLRRHNDALETDRLMLVTASGPAHSLLAPAIDYLTDRAGFVPTGATPATASSRPVRFAIRDDLPNQGYELRVDGSGVFIEAHDRRGFLYGAITLRQWLALHDWTEEGGTVPGVEIRDRPDFAHRGYLIDISRNKVPHLTTLFRLVDLLTELKYNELQLYTEHTFAYPGHEKVWEGADPLTPEEIQQLDGYCRLRGVELIPNQNSFGHFHRWLVHEPYRRLAECPEGIEHPFSDRTEPFSLCPTDPDSLALLHDLYGKLLPNFTSGRFHVGFDETFEVGHGRSEEACRSEGLAAVFLGFLKAVHNLADEHGRRLMIWADMLLEHRELLTTIPNDIVLCEWGYEAGHPFREDCAALGVTGCELYLCPGTSTWSSFAGRGSNMQANLAEAAAAGRNAGARGYLVTDWGDRGHLQPLSASYPALVCGAAHGWHTSDAKRRGADQWADSIDLWVLDDAESGQGEAIQKLANAYLTTGAHQSNGTALFHLLMSPDDGLGHPRYQGLSSEGLDRTLDILADARAQLTRTEATGSESHLAKNEQLWLADTLSLACEVGKARLDFPFSELAGLPPARRLRIAKHLGELAERRLALWIQRNREGGWEDSLRQFTRLGRRLEE